MLSGNCPNFSSNEWKDLENKLGPTATMQVYKDNGEDIPDFTKAPNGEQSQLLEKVRQEKGIDQAYKDKALAYSIDFRRQVGNWLRFHDLDTAENLGFVKRQERDHLSKKLEGKLDENYEPTPESIEAFRRSLKTEDSNTETKQRSQSGRISTDTDSNFWKDLYLNKKLQHYQEFKNAEIENIDNKFEPDTENLYHGTDRVEINDNGELVLNPALNFDGRTTSISLTQVPVVAQDYAIRKSGDKIVKIDNNYLPSDYTRENNEEIAFNTDQPIKVPEGAYNVLNLNYYNKPVEEVYKEKINEQINNLERDYSVSIELNQANKMIIETLFDQQELIKKMDNKAELEENSIIPESPDWYKSQETLSYEAIGEFLSKATQDWGPKEWAQAITDYQVKEIKEKGVVEKNKKVETAEGSEPLLDSVIKSLPGVEEEMDNINADEKIEEAKSYFREVNNLDENGNLEVYNSDLPFQRKSNQQKEILGDMAEKAEILKSNFFVKVEVDPDIQGAGQIEYTGNAEDRPIIRINPNYAKKDTVFHEGGHLYIDLLGGMDNAIVQEGVQMLEGSKLEKELKELYPDLSEQQFKKELLATAIGREAQEVFNQDQTSLIERFKAYLEKLFNELKSIMGLPVNRAKEMARELTTGRIRPIRNEEHLEQQVQEQRSTFENDIDNLTLQKEEELAQKAQDTIDRRIKDIKKQLDSVAEKEGKEKVYDTAQEEIKTLDNLLKQMKQAETEEKIAKFVGSAKTNLQAVNEVIDSYREKGKLDDTETARKVIDKLDSKIRAYEDIINDVQEQLKSNDKLLQYVNQQNIEENFREAKAELEKALDYHYKISFSNLKNILATVGGRTYGQAGRELQEEFNKYKKPQYKKNGYSDTKIKSEKQRYINEGRANRQQEIYEREKEHIGSLLRFSEADIDGGSLYMLSMRNINDDLIARAVEMLDNIEYENMRVTIDKMKDMDDVFQRFAKEKPQNNQLDKYDEMIENEVDDEGNPLYDDKGNRVKKQRMVSWYHSRFFEKRKELYQEKERIRDEEGDDKAREFDENTRIPWLNRNAYYSKKESLWKPKDKWKNPQRKYIEDLRKQGSAIPEMYDYLLQMATERDNKLPDHAKLGHNLPFIQKEHLTEQAQENGIWQATKDQFKQAFGVDPTDTEYGEMTEQQQQKLGDAFRNTLQVSTDVAGRETKGVPIFYRKPISKQDQSFDLASIMLMDWHMAQNYKTKTGVLTDLNALSSMMYHRDVQAKNWLGFPKMDGDKPALKQKGASNSYKLLQNIIEDRVHNIKTTGDPRIAQYISALRGWTSKMLLVGNWGVTFATLLHGKVMKWVEKHAKEFFNKKDSQRAEKKYLNDLKNGSLIEDFGRRRWYSWTNLIVERFDVMTDWRPVARKFADDSRFRQLFKGSTLHSTHTMPEHQIQATTAISVLENRKIKDKDGSYLDRDTGNKTDDRLNAMSLADAYKLETRTDERGKEVSTGRLKLDERVAGVEGYESYGSDIYKVEQDINREIKMVNMTMYGNYDKNNQSVAERDMWIGQAYMMRGWLVPGVVRRMRGIQQVFPGKMSGKQMDEESEMFYNRALDRFEEGSYVSTFKYLGKLKDDLKQAKFDYAGRWDELNDHQKANIKRTVLETSAALLGLATSWILSSMGDAADEEDENMYYLGAFYTRRLYSELTFYAWPPEFYRLLQSPAATMSMIDRVISLMMQLMSSPFERYERTEKEGDLKLYYDLVDVIGVGYTQYNRDIQDALEYLQGEPVN